MEYIVCAAIAALFICALWVNSILNQRKKNIVAKQSDELTAFYIAYQFWLDMDAPDSATFTRNEGLCGNLLKMYEDFPNKRSYLNEMTGQFVSKELSHCFPFNQETLDYYAECFNSTCHKNNKRIKWVKDHTYGALM